jgi:hypothetical protein
MRNENSGNFTRRDIFTKVLPACAVSCLGAKNAFSEIPSISDTILQQSTHKFDKVIPGISLTYRQSSGLRNGRFLRFVRFLENEIGKEKTLEYLKKHTEEIMLARGKMNRERLGKSDLKTYTNMFTQPDMEATLTMEILEDTDKAFEIKVTECLSAVTFLQAKAGDIGYARVCWGDYAWAEGFNPKIKLIRDKTLMQGHEYCNHRYIMAE